jgi:hypothetical protein
MTQVTLLMPVSAQDVHHFDRRLELGLRKLKQDRSLSEQKMEISSRFSHKKVQVTLRG